MYKDINSSEQCHYKASLDLWLKFIVLVVLFSNLIVTLAAHK